MFSYSIDICVSFMILELYLQFSLYVYNTYSLYLQYLFYVYVIANPIHGLKLKKKKKLCSRYVQFIN